MSDETSSKTQRGTVEAYGTSASIRPIGIAMARYRGLRETAAMTQIPESEVHEERRESLERPQHGDRKRLRRRIEKSGLELLRVEYTVCAVKEFVMSKT